jgi:hypothetical protein
MREGKRQMGWRMWSSLCHFSMPFRRRAEVDLEIGAVPTMGGVASKSGSYLVQWMHSLLHNAAACRQGLRIVSMNNNMEMAQVALTLFR